MLRGGNPLNIRTPPRRPAFLSNRPDRPLLVSLSGCSSCAYIQAVPAWQAPTLSFFAPATGSERDKYARAALRTHAYPETFKRRSFTTVR
jgi:hypothetical protein